MKIQNGMMEAVQISPSAEDKTVPAECYLSKGSKEKKLLSHTDKHIEKNKFLL